MMNKLGRLKANLLNEDGKWYDTIDSMHFKLQLESHGRFITLWKLVLQLMHDSST